MTNEDSPDFQVVIEDIVLRVCKLQINPGLIYGHAEILQKTPALYPYTRTEIKIMAIPSGQVAFTWDTAQQFILHPENDAEKYDVLRFYSALKSKIKLILAEQNMKFRDIKFFLNTRVTVVRQIAAGGEETIIPHFIYSDPSSMMTRNMI